MSVRRAMMGFIGPKDIFRNPKSIFRYLKKLIEIVPNDINLSYEESDFSVMGMHFKLGLTNINLLVQFKVLLNYFNKIVI